MLMSTLERCLQAADLFDGSFNETTKQARRDFARELASTSQIVERYINVPLQVETFTDALGNTGGTYLFPQHVPIRSVIRLDYDPMGVFGDNGFTQLFEGNDFTVDPDRRRIRLLVPYPSIYNAPVKTYRMQHIAGYAYHTIDTKYTIASSTGTPVASTTVYEQSNGSAIKITNVDLTAKTINFEPDILTFDEGDVLELGSGNTITLGPVLEESIVNNFPSLEAEVIRQVVYAYERRKSSGKHSTTTGSAMTTYMGEYQVLQTLKDACDNYQYYGVGY